MCSGLTSPERRYSTAASARVGISIVTSGAASVSQAQQAQAQSPPPFFENPPSPRKKTTIFRGGRAVRCLPPVRVSPCIVAPLPSPLSEG